MAYNKKEHLQANILAIKTAFLLDKEKRNPTEQERQILEKYSGFGGIKAVLQPFSSPSDIDKWPQADKPLFSLVKELYDTLKESSPNLLHYDLYCQGLKSSVLTAFYTPPELIQSMVQVFKQQNILFKNFLDPSAGNGVYSQVFSKLALPDSQMINLEEDRLTEKILKHHLTNSVVRREKFENYQDGKGQYDIVASNIPFGKYSVFDAEFRKLKAPIYQLSSQKVHTYFFVKGMESLRNGGVLCFIAPRGVLDSPSNAFLREWLMQQAHLISAVRLPDNVFKEDAGVEVGSDLIILQKDTKKRQLTKEEKLFITSVQSETTGIYQNQFVSDYGHSVFTSRYQGTNPYGQPAILLEHSEGHAKHFRKRVYFTI